MPEPTPMPSSLVLFVISFLLLLAFVLLLWAINAVKVWLQPTTSPPSARTASPQARTPSAAQASPQLGVPPCCPSAPGSTA